jgi:hypothetical protein
MLRFHLAPVRMATIMNTATNVGEDAGGNANDYNHYVKQYGGSSKN